MNFKEWDEAIRREAEARRAQEKAIVAQWWSETMPVTCPGCKHSFEVCPNLAGTFAECHKCRMRFQIPCEQAIPNWKNSEAFDVPSTELQPPNPVASGMMSIICPYCKRNLQVPSKFAGKRGKCKKCGESFSVGQGQPGNNSTPTQTSSTPARVPPPMPSEKNHPNCKKKVGFLEATRVFATAIACTLGAAAFIGIGYCVLSALFPKPTEPPASSYEAPNEPRYGVPQKRIPGDERFYIPVRDMDGRVMTREERLLIKEFIDMDQQNQSKGR